MRLLGGFSAAVVALLFIAPARADDFPKRPITMIVPFAAGGTSDVIARTVADQMSVALGQTVVIENVAGAGGSTALARAARADADGYTIAIGNAGTSAAAYTIYPKLPFTPDSFAPIAMVAKTFGIVALRKDFPAANVQEFIAYAKKNPEDQSRPRRCRLVEFSDLQELCAGGRNRCHAGRLSRRSACTDRRGRRPDRRRLRRGGIRVAVDQREAGAGARGRLDGAACEPAGSVDLC
jgi:Tripartite tricarboxylate transporter family receptor